jgi:hypothetical protein
MTLAAAVEDLRAVQAAYEAQCLRVWESAVAEAPELARAMHAMGWDAPAAARWLCDPWHKDAPLDLILSGQSAAVAERMWRTAHGFVG